MLHLLINHPYYSISLISFDRFGIFYTRDRKKCKESFWIFFIAWFKNGKKILIFGEEGIIKNKFHIYEKSVIVNKVDVKRIILLKKESYGNKGTYKYFIGYIYIYIYIYEDAALPLSLSSKFSQMNAYVKYFDRNSKYMIFFS